MAFFKKETEHDRILAEISSMEFKKKSILLGIENEIGAIEQNKNTIFTQIGLEMFVSHKEEKEIVDFADSYSKVIQLDEEIAKKRDKYSEVEKRTDEEIEILRANINAIVTAQAAQTQPTTAQPVQAQSTGSSFCGSCGGAVTAGDAFCQGCGQKL